MHNNYKLSISVPQQQYDFIEDYQENHALKTRSEVIQKALYLLQQLELEACYAAVNEEICKDFDNTLADGLEDETW